METPEDVAELVAKGMALLKARQYDRAINHLEQARRTHPDAAPVHATLAGALHLGGRVQDAVSHYVKALEIGGYDREAVSNLSVALVQLGARVNPLSIPAGEASSSEAALQLCKLTSGLLKLNRANEARSIVDRAVLLAPDSPDVLLHRGKMHESFGELDQAVETFRRATELDGQRYEGFWAWGLTLAQANRLEEALIPLRNALAVMPTFGEGHDIVGRVLESLGRFDEAEACFQAAVAHGVLDSIFRKAVVPVVAQSRAEIVEARRAFGAILQTLLATPGQIVNPEAKAWLSYFYLAYHDENNRPFKEAYSAVLRAKVPWLNYISERLSDPAARAPDGRIRIGFISEFFYNHTIAWLNRGLIGRLDRQAFHVTVFRFDGAQGYSMIENLADHVVTLPVQASSRDKTGGGSERREYLRLLREAIERENLKILFYTDTGMSGLTLLLAHSRLAPIQITTWGHPDTTGIDTIDYFVSSNLMEPQGSAVDYSERLINLDGLCCYERRLLPSVAVSRKDLDLPATGTLYGCPQSLFKLHPDFDPVLAEIAKGDPQGWIVMIEPSAANRGWLDALKHRWRETYPALLERTVFLRQLSPDRFIQLSAICDVLLDPIYFGGGNTVYEAMIYGTPVVTMPGAFVRGNIASAIYKQMKVHDAPVCKHVKQYVHAALTLGKNPKAREKLRKKLTARADSMLFEDVATVREFEAFFKDAVAAAARGERLDSGWRSGRRT